MKHQTIYSFVPVTLLVFLGFLTTSEISATSYVSVSPADFNTPAYNCGYALNGVDLWNGPFSARCLNIFAGLNLPNGVEITNVTFYWTDYEVENASLDLFRNNLNGTSVSLVTLNTSGDAGNPSSSSASTSIEIDNALYSYYLKVQFPDLEQVDIRLHGVIIQYEYTVPLYQFPLYLPYLVRK